MYHTHIICIAYIKSNINNGRLHSPKMATMIDSIPYALLMCDVDSPPFKW